MRPTRPVLFLGILSLACSAEIEPPASGSGGTAGTMGGSSGQAGMPMAGSPASGAGGAAAGTGGAGSAGVTSGGSGGTAGTGMAGSPAGGAGSAGEPSAGSAGSPIAGMAGAAGMTPGLESCPAPPAGATNEAIVALNTENTIRLAMGLDCAELIVELITAAQNHCNYYVTNQGDAACEAPSAHDEIEGCPEFTGEGLGDRMRAAGYTGGGGSECMAFTGDPERSTMMFVDSVYHRTPVLDPWMRHLGYGFGDGCDTIDYGRGTMTAEDVTALYPYSGQTGVPTSFDGSREGPEPPMPGSGWPSGYPVTLYARDITVSSHTIMVDGTTEDLPHQWLDESDPTLPSYAKVLYTDAPLTANTTYRVTIQATREDAPLDFDWTFTTGEANGGRPGRP